MPYVNVLLTIRCLVCAGLAYKARNALTNVTSRYALRDMVERRRQED
jgi:hypothetical protein